MVDFGYNNKAIRNQKHFKRIANGNVAYSGIIALTDEPLSRRKPGEVSEDNINDSQVAQKTNDNRAK